MALLYRRLGAGMELSFGAGPLFLRLIYALHSHPLYHRLALAKLYSLQGEMERAQRLFTHIVRAAPDSPEAAKALDIFTERGISGLGK